MYGLGFISVALLSLLSAASPIDKRAGGPAFVPLAPGWTVYDPLTNITYPGDKLNASSTSRGKAPRAELTADKLYEFILPEPDAQDPDTRFKGCAEQCNGFGGSEHNCKSLVYGRNVPSSLGNPSYTCILYKRPLTPEDFVDAANGAWSPVRAGNLMPPA